MVFRRPAGRDSGRSSCIVMHVAPPDVVVSESDGRPSERKGHAMPCHACKRRGRGRALPWTPCRSGPCMHACLMRARRAIIPLPPLGVRAPADHDGCSGWFRPPRTSTSPAEACCACVVVAAGRPIRSSSSSWGYRASVPFLCVVMPACLRDSFIALWAGWTRY